LGEAPGAVLLAAGASREVEAAVAAAAVAMVEVGEGRGGEEGAEADKRVWRDRNRS
jgi:hypothetical protein